MNKLLIGLPALAMAAFAIAPRVSAASGVMYSSMPGSRTSIPIIRRITNIGGKINVGFRFDFREKEGNPAPVRGLQTSTEIIAIDGGARDGVWTSNNSLMIGSMTFSKVGDYAFELTEVYSSDEDNFPIDTNKYEVYFRVTNKLDDNNNPTGELNVVLMDYLYSEKAGGKVGLNQAIFESVGNYTHVSLENKVTGNAADTDKYFKYRVDFEGLPEGATLAVNGQDAQADYNGETVPTVSEYIVGEEGLIVYLKHGQTVTIGERANRGVTFNELPQGTSYTITKLDDDDGYTTSIDGESSLTTTKTVAKPDAVDFTEHNTTVAGNNKEAAVNTGVVLNALPFATVVLAGVGGLFAYRRMSRQ